MKKLLGGIFQKQKDPQSSPGAQLSPQEKLASAGSTGSTASHGALRAVSPPVQNNAYKHGPRSNWDSFFSSHSVSKSSPSPSQKASTSSVQVSPKVFAQNLEMLMREIVAKTKLVITKMIDDVEFQSEFSQLCGFINLAADKLLEKGDPSLLLLKDYFTSTAGMNLCEQTAFPSLVLDFVDKVRIYLLKNELRALTSATTSLQGTTGAEELERPIHFLMSCVQAIASNAALMELFRCELPNVIYLTAEDYPPKALYLRDLSSQVLASISDKNFNAGLVWYLNDCNTIGRSVRMMSKYLEAPEVSPSSAADAMNALTLTTRSPISNPSVSSKEPIATAVGDALGLNRNGAGEDELRYRPGVDESEEVIASEESTAPLYQVITKYDPLPGLKSLVYTLQKTCRFSLVLLGEFQSSGGYGVLSSCVELGSDSEISNLIYLFTLLLPLGTGFSGVCGDGENMATINTCGARNIGAFLAFRDLVLKVIGDLRRISNADAKVRSELLILQLLTTILQVYTSAYENFLCLEQKTQALAMIMTKLPMIQFYDAKVIILRIVEYVCAAAKPDVLLPMEILAVLCNQFVEFTSNEVIADLERIGNDGSIDGSLQVDSGESTASLLCECLTRILQNTTLQAFRDELNSFGLLERGVYSMFVKVASSIAGCEDKSTLVPVYLKVFHGRLQSWTTLTNLMIKDKLSFCVELREMQIHHSLYVIAEAMLLYPTLQPGSASVFGVFVGLATCGGHQGTEAADRGNHWGVLQSGIECDLAKLLELLQAVRRSREKLLFMLNLIKQMIPGDESFWCAWQTCQGYEILVSMLSTSQELDQHSPRRDDEFQLFDALLEMLCVTLDPVRSHNRGNLEQFNKDIGYSAIAGCLVTSGVLETSNSASTLNRVFELITGQSNPRNKVRNPYAVETLFCLLPLLSAADGEASLKRLVSKITCNDDVGFSRKMQIASLVEAGVFKWLAEPRILELLQGSSRSLQDGLLQFVIEVSSESLSTHHLREYIRVIARVMPTLLGNYRHPAASIDTKPHKMLDDTEVGLQLLQVALKGSVVPQVFVGTSARTNMTSGYVKVSSQGDKMWPPPNGYSLSCWLRLPAAVKKRGTSDPIDSKSSEALQRGTVCVALCEGRLVIKLEGDDADTAESYGVLVGAELSIFESAEAARAGRGKGQGLLQTLAVTGVVPTSAAEFVVCCEDRRYIARSVDTEKSEMWVRALQQSESITQRAGATVKATASSTSSEGVVYIRNSDSHLKAVRAPDESMDGFTCLMSAYSSEFAGCYTRIFFDQTTACLRVDSGSVGAGPNVNAALKRTTAVFKNVNMDLLRPETVGSEEYDEGEAEDKIAHWHHVAITHRKSALGNSQVVLYIDGAEVATKKLSYPTAPALSGFQAYLGKDIQICGTYPALPWHMGPTWCIADVISTSAIACIFLLGPSFAGQFSGHAYRSVGDWPEAIASCQLDRATKRRVEIARVSRRVQLSHLGKAARRHWCESGNQSSSTGLNDQLGNAISELLMKKSDDQSEGTSAGRASDSRRKHQRLEEFSAFISGECDTALFGLEILEVLSGFKVAENDVLFSINTSLAHSTASIAGDKTSNSPVSVQFVGTECSAPLDLAKAASALGGVVQLLLPLIENSWRPLDLTISLKLLTKCVRRNPSLLAELLELNGYAVIVSILRNRHHLIDEAVLKASVRLAVSGHMSSVANRTTSSPGLPVRAMSAYPLVVDAAGLSQVLLSRSFRLVLTAQNQLQLLAHLKTLIVSENPNAIFNTRQLRRSGYLAWLLTYLSDLCNGDSTLDVVEGLQLRACFPVFQQTLHTKLLEQLVDCFKIYVRLENHIDDVAVISEHLLLSLAAQASAVSTNSTFRVVILQVLLHEVEQDCQFQGQRDDGGSGANSKKMKKEDGAEPFSSTMVDAVLYRGQAASKLMKKKKDRQEAVSTTITSPVSSNLGATSGDSLELVLLEIIRRFEGGAQSQLESLLATRLLFSLCQSYPAFAQYVLHNRFLLAKFKRALSSCSSDCNFYTPILAYLSNIPIGETKYHDPVLVVDGPQQFALPTPCGFSNHIERRCLDQVWELLGSLLLHNCQLHSDVANRVIVIILTQLSFQIEVNDGFFATVCYSSFPVLRVLTQCLLRRTPRRKSVNRDEDLDLEQPDLLQKALACLLSGEQPETSYGRRAVACLDLLKTFITRALFDRDDFSMNLIFLLECIDEECEKHDAIVDRSSGQKCWLALFVSVVKQAKALGENCSLSLLKNLCTLSIALARYLLNASKHQAVAATTNDNSEHPRHTDVASSSCFGVDVLVFFVSAVRLSAETQLAQRIGAEDQQFFFACFVYCAQAVLLSELNGVHRSTSPPQRLLDCVVAAKSYFVQQTKVSGVMICGNSHQHAVVDNDSTAAHAAPRGGINVHLNKMKSLTTGAFHKEFGIGAESDRNFVLAVAADLFRWLVDDSEAVRYASIELWQFFIQHRAGVLKELLVVEPKVSLLQNISAGKKEVIDVFHGGFDRLLMVSTPQTQTRTSSSARVNSHEQLSASSRESWLQFHNWLTENYELLKDLILTRTDPILQHMSEVILSCESVRKVNLNANASRMAGHGDWSLHLDFRRLAADGRGSASHQEDEVIVNSASDLQLDPACRFAARKALLKSTAAEESAVEAMRDAATSWREILMRLQNTRAIWHLGGWNEAIRNKFVAVEQSPPRSSANQSASSKGPEPFYLERTVFQQNAFKYRLDYTEGPQRLRLRLARSFVLGNEAATQQPPMASTGEEPVTTLDPLQRKLEFHQCIETYRNFMYKRSQRKSSDEEAQGLQDMQILREVLALCSVTRIKALLQDLVDAVGETDLSRSLAMKIYAEFLDDDKASQVNVAAPTVEEIAHAIASANNASEPVPLTSILFDAADRELMQATLVGASRTGGKTVAHGTEAALSDDEDEDDVDVNTQNGPAHALSDSEDSDSDSEERGSRFGSRSSRRTDSARVDSGKSVHAEQETSSEATRPGAEQDGTVFDSSADYVYGGVARFLHRDDYPPMRSFNAGYVVGMSKIPGVFLVCRHAIYFISGYEKVYNIDASPAPANNSTTSSGQPIQGDPTSPSKGASAAKKKTKDLIRDTFADIGLTLPGAKAGDAQLYSIVPLDPSTPNAATGSVERWSIKYHNVKQFYRIKYQLRPVGIEYFDIFGSTFFLQFESMADREDIVKMLFQMPIVNSVFWNPLLRSSALSLSVKRIRQSLTKRWLKGDVSNFEYLMHLNTLAGRSFNDITQYPVFPWVLADYTSTFLDLEDPATYRDLKRTMGALGENRAALFRERFAALNHDAGHGPMDTPAFHYGTHYSCSAYVINYLIRLEPFSQLARDLQGGSFDHADRLFRSIPSSWVSASAENLQDVRELIPEFFFLPEFLYNANNYDLGTTQSGEVVSHVKLPPWAHGDPREFIRLHRSALESRFVSENLHHWIDLIFGFKQTGPEALDAQNVFMHFTYEGAVDLDEIEDPVMRAAMVAQIENFGQTPSKLFTSPHPARRVPTLIAPPPAASSAAATSTPASPLPASIGQPYEGNTMGSIEAFIKWHTPLAPALISIGKDYVFLKKQHTGNSLDAPVGDVQVVSDKFLCRGTGCTFIPPRFSKFLEWGHSADGTMKVRVHNSSARHREANKVVGVIEGAHHSRVNCAAFSEDGVILVTGGDDAVVNVLECFKEDGKRLFKQLAKLVGHEDVVTSVAIDRSFNVVASASNDGCVILWDLRTRTFLRELGGHLSAVLQVGINSASANIISCTASEVRLWSVNGDLLAATSVQAVGLGPVSRALSTHCESWQNGVVAVTGHSNGTIALWGLLYPSDLARERRDNASTEGTTTSSRTANSSGTLKAAVRVGVGVSTASNADGSVVETPTVLKAVPSCQFVIKKLLVDHRTTITALTLGADQRQLVSGDSDGNCIRWVDDSVSTNAI